MSKEGYQRIRRNLIPQAKTGVIGSNRLYDILIKYSGCYRILPGG